MNRQNLRNIAIGFMLASGVSLFAQQPTTARVTAAARAQVAVGGAGLPTVGTSQIEGRSLDGGGSVMAKAPVQLRDVQTGKIFASSQSNAQGLYSFKNVPTGNYVVEMLDAQGKVVATSQMLSVTSGQLLWASVSAPAGFLGGVGAAIGEHAALSAIVISSAAAAAGILAVQAGDCVSPPCQ